MERQTVVREKLDYTASLIHKQLNILPPNFVTTIVNRMNSRSGDECSYNDDDDSPLD